jgi:gamma-glutamyltranspeptidase / glutathione hydrolase
VKRTLTLVALLVSAVPMLVAQVPVNLYGRAANGTHGVVAAAKPEASQVGLEILKKGGNAVDAAIATGFALGVLEPNATGIGGGGFMIIKLANMKEAVVIDFREVAPGAAKADMYKLDEKGAVVGNASVVGGLANGVPGEVAGLLYAFDHYGSKKITRAQLIQPAIDWANKGIPVTVNLAGIIKDNYEVIKKFPACASVYLKDGLPYEIGDTIKNPDLAKTLKLVAEKGVDAIYKGEIAQKIADESQKQGGILTVEDLANYKVEVRKPVVGSYRGYTIMSVPPASSGGTILVELLNIMENFDLSKTGAGSAATAHLWSESMKLVFADRAKYMADTAFVKVPLTGLTSKAYAKELAAQIATDKSMPSATAGDPSKFESGSTTSMSVMDKDGNMVNITKSINYFFGSGVLVPGTGFIMNDHMDDFVMKPGSANSIEPGKRPLSSISPTLVLDPKGRAFMTLGSPGATRIFTTVAQVISNVIDFNMPIQDAILAPRYFQMASGNLNVEGRVSLNTFNKLGPLGHTTTIRNDWDAYFGGVHAVLFNYDTKVLMGGADPRRDGQAAAY